MTKLAQIEVKKTLFVNVNGVEKRAKVLSKLEDAIMVQLYDGNKLQKNDDKTAIQTRIELEDVFLEKQTKTASKSNLYDVIATVSVDVDSEEGFESTESETNVIANGLSYKEGMIAFKEAEGEDGTIIELVKTYDAKAKSEDETISKTRTIGAELTKKKSVKAVYGLQIQNGKDEPVMELSDLTRKEGLSAYKEAKEAATEGQRITLITISDTTGTVVNKETYPTFVFGSNKNKVKNTYIVTIDGEVEVKDLSYNDTRKEFTAIKKDATVKGGTIVQMLLHTDDSGEIVDTVKFTHTFEIVAESEPQPTEKVVSEDENQDQVAA